MKGYECKAVKIKLGVLRSAPDGAGELLELLNREGRTGWRIARQPDQRLIGYNTVLLEREL